MVRAAPRRSGRQAVDVADGATVEARVAGGSPGRWLAVTAVAYGVLHHLGTVVSPLGDVGDGPTRWIDWVDLATPYMIVLPGALALWAGKASPRCWELFGVGAVTYVEGHGIHLSANSIRHVTDTDPAYLWDEVVGHYVWYAGALLMLVALVLARRGNEPPQGALTHALSLWTGLTLATNALEGGTAAAMLVAATGLAIWGLRDRARFPRVLVLVGATAVCVIAGYGLQHGGFPQPSEGGDPG